MKNRRKKDIKRTLNLALQVSFLDGRDEIIAYAKALCAAIEWGRNVV